MATGTPKKMILGSMILAGIVALAAIVDLIIAMPFAGQMVMDILFLIGAAIVFYLAWDAYKDLA